MKRREFIKNAGIAASLPILINGFRLSAKASPIFEQLAINSNAEDRILVLIQLVGGNDGLNTIIPVDQYSVLSSLRSSVLLPENSLLDFSDNLKLHPALSGLKKLWDEEKLEAVLNVGYPNQNLSHFRSTDIWTSASDYNEFITSGWLGRYLSEKHPNYPENYPNSDTPDPLSLTIGSVVSQTCQGPVYTMGMAARNIDNIYNLDSNSSNSDLDTYAGDELDFIRTVQRQTNEYVEVIESAAAKASINESLWEADGVNTLADQLKVVSRLIKGGLKTKIYVCSLGGFDTHAAQSEGGNALSGSHYQLLSNVGNAISSFQSQLEEDKNDDRVLGMTFSEFGRRIMSNDSYGTDHGAASAHFLFGNAVNNTVHGSYVELNSDVQQNDNLDSDIDFRQIYYNVLKDWFQVDNSSLNKIMFKDYEPIKLLKLTSTSVEEQIFEQSSLKIYPNPAKSQSTLEFTSLGSNVKIDIFDANGNHIKTIHNKWLAEGNFRINLNGLANYPNGMYLVKVTTKFGVKTAKLNILK